MNKLHQPEYHDPWWRTFISSLYINKTINLHVCAVLQCTVFYLYVKNK